MAGVRGFKLHGGLLVVVVAAAAVIAVVSAATDQRGFALIDIGFCHANKVNPKGPIVISHSSVLSGNASQQCQLTLVSARPATTTVTFRLARLRGECSSRLVLALPDQQQVQYAFYPCNLSGIVVQFKRSAELRIDPQARIALFEVSLEVKSTADDDDDDDDIDDDGSDGDPSTSSEDNPMMRRDIEVYSVVLSIVCAGLMLAFMLHRWYKLRSDLVRYGRDPSERAALQEHSSSQYGSTEGATSAATSEPMPEADKPPPRLPSYQEVVNDQPPPYETAVRDSMLTRLSSLQTRIND